MDDHTNGFYWNKVIYYDGQNADGTQECHNLFYERIKQMQ